MKLELMKSGVAAVTVAIVIGLTAGCASTKDLERLEQRVADVENTANNANSTAQSAQSTADAANARAEEAMASSVSATAVAEESQQCCDANKEAIQRAFGRMQMK